MAKHKNVYLNVDGCAYRGTKGTTNIIYTFFILPGWKVFKVGNKLGLSGC